MKKREKPLEYEYKCIKCGLKYGMPPVKVLKTVDGHYKCNVCCGNIGRYIVDETEISDNVNKPSHYLGKIETIDYIKDKLTPEQFEGYCIGNVHKYISRYKKKNGLEDLKKAQVYLNWAIENYNDGDCGNLPKAPEPIYI